MTTGPSRRALPLALLLPLAACAGGEPAAPQSFAPPSYAYLTPLHLDVATLSVDDRAVAQEAADVAGQSPVVPAQALEQMARDRIFPGGAAGGATFTVDQASILRQGDRLDGRLAVHLDLASGGRSGHAEAQVSRTTVGGGGDLRSRLYALTKQMMDDMNVEFEYQVRHSLPTWLQPDTATPAAVTAQPLTGSPAPPIPATAPVPAVVSPVPATPVAAPVAPTGVPAPTPLVPNGAASGVGGATPVTMSPPPGVLTAPSGMRPLPAPSMAAPTPLAAPIPYVPPTAAVPYAAPAYAPPAYAPQPYGGAAVPPPAYAVPAPTY